MTGPGYTAVGMWSRSGPLHGHIPEGPLEDPEHRRSLFAHQLVYPTEQARARRARDGQVYTYHMHAIRRIVVRVKVRARVRVGARGIYMPYIGAEFVFVFAFVFGFDPNIDQCDPNIDL